MTLDFPRPPAWTEQASCASTDPDIFFPDKGERGTNAKKVCRRCPVTAECLAMSLEHNDPHGVWGGLIERERRVIKRRTTPTTRTEDAA